MYGDSGVMRKRAAQLREQGGDIRALADHLVAQTESIAWTGRAADAMRERDPRPGRPPARRRRRPRHRRRLPRAATSSEVDVLKDQIADTERKADR